MSFVVLFDSGSAGLGICHYDVAVDYASCSPFLGLEQPKLTHIQMVKNFLSHDPCAPSIFNSALIQVAAVYQ